MFLFQWHPCRPPRYLCSDAWVMPAGAAAPAATRRLSASLRIRFRKLWFAKAWEYRPTSQNAHGSAYQNM